MKIKSEDIKNWSSATFAVVFIVAIVIFVANYAFVDWEEVMEDFNEGIEDLVKSINCKIDYKEFHYEGMCTEKEMIFDFLINQSDLNK